MAQFIEGELKMKPAESLANRIVDRPVLLFSGQGAQEMGMGRDVAEADADSMNYWKDAERVSGLPLREIYWEGSEEEMNDTRSLQPALTVANFNLWRILSRQDNLHPFAAAGHSLGEFAALAAAGVLSPAKVLEITSLRGRLMAEADPEGKGAMAAIVKLEQPQVAQIVADSARETGEIIVEANYNTPLQTVISGTKNAIARACEKAKKLKGRSVGLKVSGAFHSPMMAEANRELLPALEKADWHGPKFPIYCNVTAKAATSGGEIKKNIAAQMVSPVYWVDIVRNLYVAGMRWWVEISPRAVLGKMVGPSMAGLANQCDDLRIVLINSLSSMANLGM